MSSSEEKYSIELEAVQDYLDTRTVVEEGFSCSGCGSIFNCSSSEQLEQLDKEG